ncbi:2OG-Fe(II) oxygenase [uncultured Mycobacterium sp.]|uniref:2OG-Fe(II) oxygenase n=1 Tax=uncultured Mycobacterium sp. TaxID=171292 RepID=UPI0035CBD6B8
MAEAILDIEELERNASELRREFQAAEPFPHLVVDGLLRLSPAAASAFPDISWPWWNELPLRYQQNKHFCSDPDLIPEPFKALIRELSEPRFLRVLEQITGVRQLLPDPYLGGGGLHLSGPGGILSPHTDFHYYRALNLYRRINVLVYLNDGWSLQDGGCLSLYDNHGRAVKSVVPDWGRVVIFRTDDQSMHGVPVPVAAGKWRRSVALYYYTAAPTKNFSGDETTYWRQHGEQAGVIRKGRLLGYRGLLSVSRVISILAHIVHPESGELAKAALAYRRKAKRVRSEIA